MARQAPAAEGALLLNGEGGPSAGGLTTRPVSGHDESRGTHTACV
jgi:hypothetical protein